MHGYLSMDIICSLLAVERDREAGAQEKRGRERAESGRTRGVKRDLYEGGKREQK